MEEFTSYVDRLKKLATDTSPDELQENLYVFFANGCLLLTSFLQEDGKEGEISIRVAKGRLEQRLSMRSSTPP